MPTHAISLLAPAHLSPHCLIATADNDLHEIVNGAVTQVRCTAAFVRSGSDVVTRARARRTSLVLVDQALPDIAGLEVARSLSRETPELPFVLIGHRLTTSITVEAMKLGAFTVLEKPVPLTEMISTLRSAVVETGSVRATSIAATATGAHWAPRSISERWALYVSKACEADGDLRTLGAWAAFVGLSYSSLCESCRLVGV